jgi:hypothetical protein
MIVRHATLLLAMSATGCGATTITEPAPTDASIDGGTKDVGADSATDGASALVPCSKEEDCDGPPRGYAMCQAGFCCNGKLTDGVCRCGTGPACDRASVCCPSGMCAPTTKVSPCGF